MFFFSKLKSLGFVYNGFSGFLMKGMKYQNKREKIAKVQPTQSIVTPDTQNLKL